MFPFPRWRGWRSIPHTLSHTPPAVATTISMIVATLSYAPLLGWPHAAGLILVFSVTELGHVAAARWLRLSAQRMIFLPLVGAFVACKRKPRIVEHDAIFALAGPAAGAAFAYLCSALALYTGNQAAQWLGLAGAFVNLLNLTPLPPLDGGRVLAVVSPRLCLAGLPICGLLVFHHIHIGYDLLLVAAVSIFPLIEALRGDSGDKDTIAFYAAPPKNQVCAVIAYCTTAAILVLAYAMAVIAG